jgi:hypothetical protein
LKKAEELLSVSQKLKFWESLLLINNLALKLPREPVSGLLGIKPFATNKKYNAEHFAGLVRGPTGFLNKPDMKGANGMFKLSEMVRKHI